MIAVMDEEMAGRTMADTIMDYGRLWPCEYYEEPKEESEIKPKSKNKPRKSYDKFVPSPWSHKRK